MKPSPGQSSVFRTGRHAPAWLAHLLRQRILERKEITMFNRMAITLGLTFLIFSSAAEIASATPPYLYIANEHSNSVSVIDSATGTLIARVPTGMHPHNVNVDPSGRYFYATNYQGDAVQVFDVKTRALVAEVAVGSHPAHVVPDPAGRLLYVSNEGGTTLSVIQVPEFKVTQTLELKGKGPHGLVIGSDGRLLLTPNSRSGDVSLIDPANRKVELIQLPSGAKPIAMGITSDGKFAFVTDAGLNQVHKIDLIKKRVVGSLSVGKAPIQVPVHPTRPFLYIPCMEEGALYKVNIDKWVVEKIIPVGKGAHGIAFRADGKVAYVTLTWEKPDGRVAVVDTEKDRLLTTYTVENAPNGIALLFGKNQGW